MMSRADQPLPGFNQGQKGQPAPEDGLLVVKRQVHNEGGVYKFKTIKTERRMTVWEV
jgi:hypothetical protein